MAGGFKFRAKVTRVLSWLDTFGESEIGVDIGQRLIAIRVPGLYSKGKPNVKANTMVVVTEGQSEDFLGEIESQILGLRVKTAAEAVRRSWRRHSEGEGDAEVKFFSFRTSQEKRAREVTILAGELDGLIDELIAVRDGERPQTASEAVRRSFKTLDIGTKEEPRVIISFRSSEDSGTREVKVDEGDTEEFFKALVEKTESAQGDFKLADKLTAAAAFVGPASNADIPGYTDGESGESAEE